MNNHKKIIHLFLTILVTLVLAGCEGTMTNVKPTSFPFPENEVQWIKNGQPIEFEGQLWYPRDTVDNLLDSEVDLLGEYKGVQFFIEKIDVRPYGRLYTKFGKNKFRAFEKGGLSDQSK